MHNLAKSPVTEAEAFIDPQLMTKVRPLANVPDIILQNAYNGLEKMPDKRLSYGGYDKGDCICAVSVAVVNFKAYKDSVSFGTALTVLKHTEDGFAKALAWSGDAWEFAGGWLPLAHFVNDKFGVGSPDPNHPTMQKARYYYVLGAVSTELALRGLL